MNKNKTTYKLLELMSDGRFHSGQDLGQTLGITRSGVWKAIQQLDALGLEIHAVTGKGYRLPQGLELLNEEVIKQQLDADSSHRIQQLDLLTVTSSTNDYLLKLMKRQPLRTDNIACLAEYQTGSRGRLGRTWVSSFGSSLYLSLLWHFAKDPSEIVGLSLTTALAVVRSLRSYGIDNHLQLKWPNDVLWKGRKLAGVLIDLVAESHGRCYVVIGIGLNVQMPYHVGKEISQPWADISQILHSKPERNKLAGLLLNELAHLLPEFERYGLKPLLPEWQTYDPIIGKSVTLTTPQNKIVGVVQGISAQGELILLTENNEVKHLMSGEVSLRLGQNV
jgi:BirA family biotin operon repressor/biotin-[acetyl-CoA-carboxylase] ligase